MTVSLKGEEARDMASDEFKKALEASREVELTVTGRNSGREISLPVWFASDGEKLYLVPVTGSDSAWYKNVIETPSIRVAAAGVHLDATATPISDRATIEQILDMFRATYGARDIKAYYPKHDAAVEIPLA
jgi:deazaflavin-dependent oxidoreductase (nitroreductase family)